jgi:hypothetical protein
VHRESLILVGAALVAFGAGCNCGGNTLVPFEVCDNGTDDDKNGATDCDDSYCFNEYVCRAIRADAGNDGGTPDAGPPDAGPPDAGPPDAGPPDASIPTTWANACPGLPHTPSCGPDAGTAWRKVLARATNGLFTTVWAPRDGGELFVGGTGVYRWNGSTLISDYPDAGIYVSRLEGSAANDLWMTTSEAQDGTRLLHRTDAGWALVARDSNYFASDLTLSNGVPWLMAVTSVARPVDGGFLQVPLPPNTLGLLVSAEPNGELWIAGQANPCPALGDGGFCPRVVHGVPGVSWHVDDWPCLPANGAAFVWRRTPQEQILTGGGFIVRRIDGGWMTPEPMPFSGARMAGTANDAWLTAYDLVIGSTATGVAHFNGCVEAPMFLYANTLQTNPNNGLTYNVATGGASDWACSGTYADGGWRGELWTTP